MSATNRKAKRIVNDLYPTPDYTKVLMQQNMLGLVGIIVMYVY